MDGAKETRRPPAPTRWSEGEASKALSEFKEALNLVGITLPSLGLDYSTIFQGSPLIELGRARPDVVEELSQAIRRGWIRG